MHFLKLCLFLVNNTPSWNFRWGRNESGFIRWWRAVQPVNTALQRMVYILRLWGDMLWIVQLNPSSLRCPLGLLFPCWVWKIVLRFWGLWTVKVLAALLTVWDIPGVCSYRPELPSAPLWEAAGDHACKCRGSLSPGTGCHMTVK